MNEIKSLNLSQCWRMVNRIANLEHVEIAKEWLLKANITNEEYDELMDAVACISRELYRIPNRSFN